MQSRDGYIWLGTFEGLVRFDGISFVRYDAARVREMVDSSVTALFEAWDGSIWIGHESGAISVLRNGRFTFYDAGTERKGVRIQSLAADSAGEVWALDVSGNLVRARDGKILRPEPGPARGIFSMVSSARGEIWIIARGKLSRLAGGTLEVVPLVPAMDDYVHGACVALDGGLWVVAGGHLWKHERENWSEQPGVVPTGDLPVFVLTELHDGRLVGGTLDSGAFILDPAGKIASTQWRTATGFPSDWISAAFEDRERGLWLATGTAGLFRLSEERIEMLLPDDHMHGRAAMGVAASREGEIWVATEGAGVYRYAGNRWQQFAQESGISNPYVWSVAQDADGRTWIGTWGTGLFWFDGQSFVHENDSFADTGVAALLSSRRGGILVGALQGVFRRGRDHAEWLEPGQARRIKNVRAMLEASDGTLWVGSHGEGLASFKGAAARRYTHRDGLSSDYVDCLHEDATGSLWIGTHGGGLNRLKGGRFALIGSAHGLADDSIGHIEEDDGGYFWMSSKAGIIRVSLAELNACADGSAPRLNSVTYGLSDGLTTLNCSGAVQSAGARLPDGRLLFATDRGVAVVDPHRVKVNHVAPEVLIESGRAGEELVFTGNPPAEPVRIAPGVSRIEFRYTGLSFSAPEKVVFRRQLEPLETTPTFVGPERTAVYNYLPPGRYTFRVSAANGDGVWNETGRTVALVVLPFFWQTLWFKAGAAAAILAAAGALGWLVSRRRLHQRLERLERERAIERERSRIANDMHDDLGAHLTRISMLSDTAQREGGEGPLNDMLRQIQETTRSVTRSMDEIVWAVNPKHDTLESLVAYFEKFTTDFLRAANIRCRLDMPLEFPSWNPRSEVRHNLFLCLKEALHNVVRHSGAGTVTASIRLEQGMCLVVLADNGRGLGATRRPAASERDRFAGGNGLASMQARMAGIAGSCVVANAPGGGCVVTLAVPLEAPPPRAGASHHRDL